MKVMMPLEPMFAAPEFQLEGAYFRMSDGTKVVRCMVEAAALDAIAAAPGGATRADVFREHQQRIREMASRNYDRRELRHGIVVVTRADFKGAEES
ncbi:MAG TPA: DUF1488 family protein [Beijerinckiaceae bacterium]|nr:DUF1488 family protein [Beijerinckiaceae bacterium]